MIQVPATVKYPMNPQPRASKLPGGAPYHDVLFTTQQFGDVRVYADADKPDQMAAIGGLRKGHQVTLVQAENNGKVYYKVLTGVAAPQQQAPPPQQQAAPPPAQQQMQYPPAQQYQPPPATPPGQQYPQTPPAQVYQPPTGQPPWTPPAQTTGFPPVAPTAPVQPDPVPVQTYVPIMPPVRPMEPSEIAAMTEVCRQRAQMYAHLYGSLVEAFYETNKETGEWGGVLGDLTPSMEELGLSARTLMIKLGDTL